MTSPSTGNARVDATRLIPFLAEVFECAGMPADDAGLISDTLVQADVWGHHSHGVMRASWYVARIRAGSMRPVSDPQVVSDSGSVLVLDGRDGVGQVLAARAAKEAIARAHAHGVGAVAVRNSNHFGTAAYFTLMAPPAGCIGVLVTNGSPAMAPWGGREKGIGNNPWSIAVPAGRYESLVMDIANTAVARGKIYHAGQEARPIPPDWALNAAGEATTDPSEAIAGVLLPMGGHKGYVVALMMDVLAGVLTGSGYGSQVRGPYQAEERSRCGHLYLALEVERFLPLVEFTERVESLVEEIKSTPLAPGFDEILVPGEPEMRAAITARRQGLDLPARTLDDLRRLATAAGITAPFA